MSRPCFWSATRARIALALGLAWGVLAVFGLGLVSEAQAAVVVEKQVDIEVRADGALVETTRLRVKLEADRDLDAWSPYGIALDENRKLESLEAAVETPGGKKERLGRGELDTQSASPDGVMHASAQVRTVRFPRSPAGSTLLLDYTIVARPYFPSWAVWLGERDRVERLTVQVRGAQGLRWTMTHPTEGLQPVAGADGRSLLLTGAVARPDTPDLAPSDADGGPVLRFAWGSATDWAGVGAWYEDLVRDLPRQSEAVRRQARSLAPADRPARDPRSDVETLLAFARGDVRYVAVEVGVGGYRAASPEETLTRRWGDCKAKALLLIDLLRTVGIDGYPALIQLDERGRSATGIPNPAVFNHMIVALSAAGLARPGDPVSDGFLFVDPTHPRATVAWLHPGVQDQDALVVVGGAASHLVRTPIQMSERERLEVDGALTAEGAASGRVSLTLDGDVAAAFSQLLVGGDPERLARAARAYLEELLPATNLSDLTAREDKTSPLPRVVLGARYETSSFATLAESGVALALPGSVRMPAASLLERRTLPVVTSAGVSERVFRLTLPVSWQPPEAERSGEQNALGSFTQTISTAPVAGATPASQLTQLTIERRVELLRRWIEPDTFADLRALSLAEHRAGRRRLRLSYSTTPPRTPGAPGGGSN